MNLAYLDPKNYTFAGGFTVQSNKDLVIPDSLVLDQNMLVRWQIRQMVKGATIDQIPQAILSTSLEIPGLGVLNHLDYQISASQQGRDIVQLIALNPSLPQKIKLSQVSDLVTNSVIEFYSANYPIIQIPNMGVNNPTNNNPAALQSALLAVIPAMAEAIGQQSGAAVQQALENRAFAEESRYSTNEEIKIAEWSGDINNHKIVGDNLSRLGVHIMHKGETHSPDNNKDVFLVVGYPDGQDFDDFDYCLNPLGDYNSEANRETLTMYAWVAPGNNAQFVTVTEYFPQPAPSA
jgi:hypothetical protein